MVRKAEDASEIFRTEALGAGVSSIAVTANGDLVAIGLNDGRAMLLSTTEGAAPELLSCEEGSVLHARGVSVAVFSRNGAVLCLGGNDKRVSVWDVKRKARTSAWAAHLDSLWLLAPNRDASVIASAGRGVIEGRKLWRQSGDAWVSGDIPTRPTDHISWMKFDTDDTLMYAFSGNQIDRLNVDTMELTTIVQSADGRVFTGATSPDGSQFVIGAAQTPFLCSSKSTEQTRSLGQQVGTILAAGWVSPTRVVTVGVGGEIRAFDTRPEIAISRIKGFTSWCFSGAWSPDGSMLCVDASGYTINAYKRDTLDLHSAAPLATPGRNRAMKFMPDSTTVVCGGVDGRIRFVDTKVGVVTRTFEPQRAEIFSLAILPDQNTLVSGHADGVIRVWDASTEQVIKELPKLARRIEGMMLSPDGTVLASAGLGSGVQLWDVATWEKAGIVETSAPVWGVAFSPDGNTLFATTHSGTLEVFDMSSRARRHLIAAHQRLIPGLAVSPDGAIVATSSEDGGLRLWDAKSLRQLTTFDLNASELVHLTFDPTSRYLAISAAWRQTIVIDVHAMDGAIEGNRAFHEARQAQ